MAPSDDPIGAATVHLPAADDAAQEAVLDELLAMSDALPKLLVKADARFLPTMMRLDVPKHGEVFALSLPLVETCLDQDPNDVGTQLLAQLAFCSLWPGLAEQLALQVSFGWEMAEERARDVARALSRAEQRGTDLGDDGALVAEASDLRGTRSTRCLSGESSREPDRSRVVRGIALFRRVASHAPEGFRTPLLCIVAWLYWSIGKRPNAVAHLMTARRIDPAHELVDSLMALCSAALPGWLPNDAKGTGDTGSIV